MLFALEQGNFMPFVSKLQESKLLFASSRKFKSRNCFSRTKSLSLEQWDEDMDRVWQFVSSGKGSTLVTREIIVENTESLADCWLGRHKIGPSNAMKTYGIAAIRIDTRQVLAIRLEINQSELLGENWLVLEPNWSGNYARNQCLANRSLSVASMLEYYSEVVCLCSLFFLLILTTLHDHCLLNRSKPE